MLIEIVPDEPALARRAAAWLAAEARASVAARGQFLLAVSGGKNPWEAFRALAEEDVPWEGVHIVQVDERVAQDGDPDRNFTHLRECLLDRVPLRPDHIHPMPVTESNLQAAAARYAAILWQLGGPAPVLDAAHLGLGPDGHTASLVPGDPVLEVADADVAITGVYQGRRRMTLTYPILNRARRILWLIGGAAKADMLARVRKGDSAIPAGRICGDRAFVLADRAAASRLEPAKPPA